MEHVTVLQREAVASLQLASSHIVVDATYGNGGHAAGIVARLGANGTFIGIDADETAFAAGPPKSQATVHLVHDNFRNLSTLLKRLELPHVNGILADLGWRQDQFTQGGRGFSFLSDEPLHMTYGDPAAYPFTAHDIVNSWSETAIADVLYGYGEERAARRIARAITDHRQTNVIATAQELAALVQRVIGSQRRKGRIHPATRTFQALRIAVNDELGALEAFLEAAVAHLVPNGRLSVITFHSIEDRLVKRHFKSLVEAEQAQLLTKKPVVPLDEEIADNPRARSAKLRTLIKM